MVMCWASDCKHYNQRESCSFFKFPKEPRERNRWKKLVRRNVEPGPGAFLCSCHFRDGKRENGPEIFLHNVSQRITFTSFTSAEGRKRVKKEMVVQKHADGLPGKSLLKGLLESDMMPPPSEIETIYIVVDNPSSNEETSDFSNLPELSESGTSVETQPSCSKDSAEAYRASSDILEAENKMLKKKIKDLEHELENLKVRFSFKHIKSKDNLILLYTGLPNAKIFMALYGLIENIEISYHLNSEVEKISRIDQLLMCLMKLRQNFPHADIAQRFQVSKATVGDVVTTWIRVLHEILFDQLMSSIRSRNENNASLPTCFSTFICTETPAVTSSSSSETQIATCSSSTHCNTWKVLIGVAPDEVISFISDLYPSSKSDEEVIKESGVLSLLKAGDVILADESCLLKDILPPGVHINVPPFLNNPQSSPDQVEPTESITRARLHFDRAIRRMKCYKILKFFPFSLVQHVVLVVQVVGALANYNLQLEKWKNFMLTTSNKKT